jgi:flavodoxin
MSSNSMSPTRVLIVFYSRYGNTAKMAQEIAYGAKEVSNIKVTIRRITDDVLIQKISKNPDWTMIASSI